MEIDINNKKYKVAPNSTVKDVLREIKLPLQVAVWVNGRKLLQQEYLTYRLQPGDQLKIIKPLAGG